VRAWEMLMYELRFTHTAGGRTRVLCWYDFVDANLPNSVLFQRKERFMVTFQPKALFILTLLLW
jgi:hypothetical protein